MRTELVILALGVALLAGLALWPLFLPGDAGIEAGPGPVPAQGALIDAGPAGAPAAPSGPHGPAHGVQPRDRPPREDGALAISFVDLASYEYAMPGPDEKPEDVRARNLIPESVRALGGKEVAIEGYMTPIKLNEEGRVEMFLLSRFLGACCFGAMPRMNEWLEVVVTDPKGADYVSFRTVVAVGALEVGEAFDEYGYVMSLYRMRARAVEKP